MKNYPKLRLLRAAAWTLSFSAAAAPLRAEPTGSRCPQWMGTAREWSTYNESKDRIETMTLRDCGGIPKGALSYARRCMQEFGDQLASKKNVIIGDFSSDANFVRLYVLEWNQEDPEGSIPLLRGGLVHGAGNGSSSAPAVARAAVDQWNSNATPGGCMRLFGTGNETTIPTVARNLRAYRLDGLERRNACTATRGIFFHESYLENDENKVKTRRIEEVDGMDPRAADFGRIKAGHNLGTALTPGCITASDDDFDFIKTSGIVPDPGPGWKTGSPARAKEGILFVSWFWGDEDDQTIVPRSPRACTDPSKGMRTPAIPAKDGYLEALKQLQQWK